MIKKKIYILVGLCLLMGCQSTISISNMADVMIDISLAMNYTQQQIVSEKITDTNRIKLMQKKALDTVLAIHRISPKEFKKNYDYYINRPTDMQTILDTMNQRSNRLLNPSSKPLSTIK